MTAAICTQTSELPKEQSQCKFGNAAEKLREPSKESQASKSKGDKENVIQIQVNEEKVKATPKAEPASSKSNKKVRPKTTKKLSRQAKNKETRLKVTERPKPPSKKSARTRKENARYREKKKGMLNLDFNGEKGVSKSLGKIWPRQIPLVIPSARPHMGIARSTVKYTLTRAESNRVHRRRVRTNQRRFGRRNRTSSRKKQSRLKYILDYWKEPEVSLDDLSSLDCGSYSENVEKSSTEEEVAIEELYSNVIPSDFVFNINAPEFIPKGADKKRAYIFTMSELVESVKGQQLPSMPELDQPYP